MATTIQTPYQVPIFNAQGSMNPQWLAWFNAVSSGLVSSSSGTVDEAQVVQIIENTVPAGLVDYTVPPRLTGFKVTGGFNMIFIEWDQPNYPSFGYVEIYRSNSEIFTYAIPVGTAVVNVFGDTPPDTSLAHTYYYWARAVSKAGVPGPFNAVLGTPGTTADDPTYLLQVLENQLSTDQLNNTLNSRIDLIDTPTTGLVDSLATETLNRIDSITAEQNARITAVNEEQTARQDLAIQLRGEYTGTDVNQLVTGLIYSESNARIDQDNSLAQQISLLTAGVAGGFDPYKTWYFDSTDEGWAGYGATVTWGSGSEGMPGVITVTSTSTNPQLYLSTDLTTAIVGNRYSTLRIRIKRTGGSSSSWDGTLYYKTASHGFSSSYKLQIVNPVIDIDEIASLDWDMSAVPDWLSSSITNLRLDIGAATDDVFEIDWIAIGRNAPGASVASLLDEATARATADTAEATARQTLSTKVIGVPDPTGVTLATLASGLIYDEKTARSSADSAGVTSRQSLSATLTGYTDPTGKTLADINTGIIYEEKTARATADGAMASSISTLSATTAANTAAITAMNNVASSSTSANAQALYSVSSKVNNPSTGLDSKSTVTELTTVNSDTLKSVATAINQTTTVLNGKTTTVETMAEAVDGVSGSYTVKVDSNGYVAGFGLAISGNTSTPTSTFRIVADAFSIAPTASSYGASAQSPFFHLSSTQYVPEMGVTLPAGTYMKSAYIGDATITSAKIGSLSADKITAGTIAAAVSMTSASITGGVITGGTIRTNPYGVGVVTIADDVLTVKDSNGVVRVKIGKLN